VGPERILAAVAGLAVVGGVATAGLAWRDTPSSLPAPSAGSRAVVPHAASPLEDPMLWTPSGVDPGNAATSGTRDPGDEPVRLRIPAVGVSTRLVRLGIARDGTMEVPTDFSVAGWLAAGPAPGERGPAVIAGHVDGVDGPAVFYRIRALRPGDAVEVVQRDGDVVRFVVRTVVHVRKEDFPTDQVYGPAPGPVLRLITCSGDIDPSTGHYTDDTVVYAS
jgi:sortase (surface protein transpeptidase)